MNLSIALYNFTVRRYDSILSANDAVSQASDDSTVTQRDHLFHYLNLSRRDKLPLLLFLKFLFTHSGSIIHDTLL